ncbi:ATP-binding protein [Pseudomonas taiwanensis]|uniref:AAA+ ATPase domain-containing protein n=1 Tax=Pseudomonas taiwanensis SJ9 TaxID=1388762 RepID=V7D624_9PSED|nr:ATP-binding protein [Pseudomonas taiwanensis]ESW36706.1 hypothetical protein O164_28650 [Pseudomonas taiwanensis SJ9]
MKCDLSLRKRREIARAVLEGLHGFQHCWPERTEVYDALDATAEATDAKLIMLSGHAGVGISSMLEAFASKYHDRVIVVRPRIYAHRLNLIDQVLHAFFPFSEFRNYMRVPDSLIAIRQPDRNIIVIDDLDIVSNQNAMYKVVFDQLIQLAGFPSNFTIIMSTRNKKLLRDYLAIKRIRTTLIQVPGLIPASMTGEVVQCFFDWCNQKYGTDVRSLGMAPLGKWVVDMPIDRIVFESEALYCAELLKVSLKFDGSRKGLRDSLSSSSCFGEFAELRQAVEYEAFE